MKGSIIYQHYLLTLLLVLLIGCSLEEKILDESTGTELLEQADIELNIMAPAYGVLTGLYGCCSIFQINEITTDESIVPAKGLDWFDGGSYIRLHTHNWSPSNGVGGWGAMEGGIARANSGLFLLLERADLLDPNELRSFQAELRFLRAFYRYHLLDWFRQVPMRDELDQNFNEPPPVFNNIEAFDWLVEELETIIPDLKDHGDITYGRITKQAAYTLLAKLFLNAEVYTGTPKWAECIDACNAVIGSGKFALSDDYFQLFSYDNDENNPEAIFVIRQSFETNNKVFFTPSFVLHYSQNLGRNAITFNGYATTEEFFFKWDQDNDPMNGVQTTDIRFQDDRILASTGTNLGFLEGPQFHPDGSPIQDPQRSFMDSTFVQLDYTPEISNISNALQHEGVRVMKYEPDPEGNIFFLGRNDTQVFRYADVWLMKAEALFRTQQAGAFEMVNELRMKRGVPPLMNLTEQLLLDERGFELYWEGHRRQDLVRFGQFTSGTWAFKEVSEEHKNVFPIDESLLNINENLVQNPGY
ncbi:MAG: RagB/SusD family nutrient uptake outer membrane protein [Bacteroidia bacterium]|nr:RagB/SusD family nutrient uptake outer membrane protein [Bacteroidia bacterium]